MAHQSEPGSSPPLYEVRLEKNVLIPTRDGTRLAADLHWPVGDGPFPVILEYIPYRKDDNTVPGHGLHYYFARRGYVGVRLDVRGTGASEGINTDEYMPVEQEDGYDAIEWLAAQPWCTGAVAMWGISYGGFTSLQVAMHRPPHLKAIMPMYATDDRYTDDCHYQGGNLRGYYDVAAYGGNMVAMNALAPYPEYSGADWARIWQQHLEHNLPYLPHWLSHQTDGDYWRHGSLRGHYDRIQCATLIVGGWHDGYPNTPLRIFEALQVPKRVIIGPWTHKQPDASVPGPRIDYLREFVRWCDQWCRGIETGVLDEPPIAVYMRTYATPRADLDEIPGYWRAERAWPLPGASPRTLHLAPGGTLAPEPSPAAGRDPYAYRPTVGICGGLWSGGTYDLVLPVDQREDEAHSLSYTTEPLTEALEILGWPDLALHAESSAPVAAFVAKLCDVAPDGTAALVTRGVLNATRRRSLRDPEPLQPGEVYELSIRLDCTSWVFPPGHRVRLDVSSADWPNVWPTPEPATNAVHHGGARPSRLTLPVAPAPALPAPDLRPAPPRFVPAEVHSEPQTWRVVRDVLADTVGLELRAKSVTRINGGDIEFHDESQAQGLVSNLDPARVHLRGTHRFTIRRSASETVTAAHVVLESTRSAFHLTIDLTIDVDGRPHWRRSWTHAFPRHLL